MKRLTCEMCGNVDLIKQDGVFVCQACGCKYSVEEARKMMIEGTVDVSGSTIKVDNSSQISNYKSLAETAFQSKNFAEAEKYWKKVLELDPKDSKAWICRSLCMSMHQEIKKYEIETILNGFATAYDCATDEKCDKIREEIIKTAEDFTMSWLNTCCDSDFEKESSTYLSEVVLYTKKTCEILFPLFEKMQCSADSFKKSISTKLLNTANKKITQTKKYLGYSLFAKVPPVVPQYYIKYINNGLYASSLIELLGDLSDSKEEKIRFYERSIKIYQSLIYSKSGDGSRLNDQSISNHEKKISELREKIDLFDPFHVSSPYINLAVCDI